MARDELTIICAEEYPKECADLLLPGGLGDVFIVIYLFFACQFGDKKVRLPNKTPPHTLSFD